MNNHPFLSILLDQNPLWGQSDNPIWVSSRFTLKRNLASFPFPAKMTKPQTEQLLSLLKHTLINLSPFDKGVHCNLEELSSKEKEALAEHFLMEGKAKFYLIDTSGSFLMKIQEDDHLSFSCIESTSNWDTKWKKCLNFEKIISDKHAFAFSPKFGYLSSNPTLCGTGLIVEAILHTPCLIHLEEIEDVLEKSLGKDVIASGLGGGNEYIGELIVIKNQFTLGISEDHILDAVHKVGTELMTLETQRREKLKKDLDLIMRDKISRAYGLLVYSFQIETKEAFAALSLLKLGIDLQWVHGMTDQEISTIFFKCRRAHLTLGSNEDLTSNQISQKRAEYLKQQCTKIKLTI